MSVNYLSEVMNDKRPASLVLKIKLWSRLGYDKSSDLLVELLPDDAAEAWAQWETKKTEALGRKGEKRADSKEAKEDGKANGDKASK